MKVQSILLSGTFLLAGSLGLIAQENTKEITIVNTKNGATEVQHYEGAEADSFLKAEKIDIEHFIEKGNPSSTYSYSTSEEGGVKIDVTGSSKTMIIKPDGEVQQIYVGESEEAEKIKTILSDKDIQVIMVNSEEEIDIDRFVTAAAHKNNVTEVRTVYQDSRFRDRQQSGLSTEFSNGLFSYDLDVDGRHVVDIRVTDDNGKVVHKGQVKGNDNVKGEIDLSKLGKGSYTISFQTDDWTKTASVFQL